MDDNHPLWYGELRVSSWSDTEKAKCAINIKKKHYVKGISMLWKRLDIPILLTESVMREVFLEIFSEETKLAERETVHNIAIAIKSVLKKHGIIGR
jgi:hypothetical protein